MSTSNIMSGARLSPGGLHLGHYLGCLSPLAAFPKEKSSYFFVIGDTSPIYRQIDQELHPDFIAMTSDLLSTPFGDRIKVVQKSKIVFEAPVLLHTLHNLVTFQQVLARHPQRAQIRTAETIISIGEFFFILYEILQFLALDVGYVFMNTDNLKFVDFARRVARKFNNKYGKTLYEPSLKHGIFPRLLGYNGQKMAKSNKNCIFLAESHEALKKKTNKLIVSKTILSFLGGAYVPPVALTIPDDFLPFTYLRVFGSEATANEISAAFCSGKLPLPDLASEVLKVLEAFVSPMRAAQEYYRHHPKLVWDRVKENTQEAIEIAHVTERRVVSAIRAAMSK